MLIRSQNKRWMIVLENAKTIAENWSEPERHEIWAEYDCNPVPDERVLLGEYSTFEKALKVLDMMQEAYEGYILEDSRPIGNGYYKQSFGYTPPRVFQMPQDEEVEA